MRKNKIHSRILSALMCAIMVATFFTSAIMADSASIRGFIVRLYESTMSRTPMDEEVDYWEEQVNEGKTAADLVSFFFNSDEFTHMGLMDGEFVEVLYVTLLDRTPDEPGVNYWVTSFTGSYTRNMAIRDFVATEEFGNICANYGITRGSITVDILETEPNIVLFVNRAYNQIFGRNPDEAGLRYWVTGLKNGRITGAELLMFLFGSAEYQGSNPTNTKFITDAYRAAMGRDADTDGVNYWLYYLDVARTTKKYILRQFVDSAEFTNLCSTYGITAGTIDLTDPIDLNPNASLFAGFMYRRILDREPDIAGLRTWTSRLASGASTGTDLILGLIYSSEFTNANPDTRDFVIATYRAFTGNANDAAGITYWTNQIDESMVTRRYVLKSFALTSAYTTLCDTYGVRPGSISVSENRDRDSRVNDLVINAYRSTFLRNPTIAELNEWTGKLLGGISVAKFLRALYTQGLNNMNASQQAEAILASAMGRTPSAGEITTGQAYIGSKGLKAYYTMVLATDEYRTRCANLSLIYDANDGFITAANGKVYYYIDGEQILGWRRFDGKLRYFDPNDYGAMAVGWKYINGYKYWFNAEGYLLQNVESIIGPQSRYYLTVNTATNTVMVYALDPATNTYCIPVKAIVCSCGTPGNDTIQGTFTLRRMNTWNVLMGNVWGQYCTQISGNYLFHSSWFYEQGNHRSLSVRQYNMLGQNASHGCVRLTVQDAKWIFDNCNGSTVRVFSSNEAAPFDKPVAPRAVVVNGDYGYDPTDPIH